MKKLRVVGGLVLTVVMAFSFVACSKGTTTQETAQSKVKSTSTESGKAGQGLSGKKFVSILPNSGNLSGLSMNDEAKKVIEAAGGEFTALFYNNDIDTMVKMIENADSGGCSGMIIQNTLTLQAGEDALKKCLADGMVICELDGDYKDIAGIQYYYGASEHDLGYAIGKMAGEWANKVLVPKGIKPIAGMYEYRGVANYAERSDGMIAGLKETCPQARIARAEQADNTTDAMNKAENWLQAYPKMNIILGIGDTLVLGGAEALKAAGKNPKLTGCFGCDATDEALKGIATSGMYKGSLNLGLDQVGKKFGQWMVDYVNGVKVEGRKRYNYFINTPVTAANIDKYYTAK